MESKKHIGKFFRENLDQMDATPSENVWNRIEVDLEEKKKKRRFIFWFFLVFISAAVLTGGLGYYFTGTTSSVNESGENTISGTPDTTIKTNQNSVNEEIIVNSGDVKETVDSKNTPSASTVNPTSLKANPTTNSTTSLKNRNYGGIKSNTTNIGSSSKKGKKSSRIANFKSASKTKNKSREASTESKWAKTGNPSDRKNGIVNSASSLSEAESSDQPTTNEPNLKSIKNDSLKVQLTDSIPKNVKKKNRKEADPLPKDSLETTKEKFKKVIIIAPYAGINYNGFIGNYDALSKGNTIDEKGTFVETYGVLVRYMISEKTGFQLGFGKLNSKYNVTVDRSSPTFINEATISTELPAQYYNELFSDSSQTTLTKETSYFEVPIEGYHVLLNKKFGIAASAGISLLYMGKNEVFAESDNVQRIKIGSFSSLLQTSSSANFKLYLHYNIQPKLSFDVYPTFQYQLFGNSDSSNYSTYFFSLRAGVSYKL